MIETVLRPLWRDFEGSDLRGAARHARAGGLAVLTGRRWRMIGDAGRGEELPLYVDWAIRAIEATQWEERVAGPLKGCVEAPIAQDWMERVDEWVRRDCAFDGATEPASFDCVRCAACCFDNRVVLDGEDLVRFRAAGRAELLRRTVTDGKKQLLPLARKKGRPCVHLQGRLCGIYEVRPNMCRDFPVGTEQCLTSREEIFGEPFPAGR